MKNAPIFVTEETSQLPIGWLNAKALKNIPDKVVAEEASQLSIGWLNDDAPLNMDQKVVTFAYSSHRSVEGGEHVRHGHRIGIPVA